MMNQQVKEPPAARDSASSASVTALLVAWSGGDEGALEALVPLVYSELRRIAERYMRSESEGQTIQTTALVHEAYLRLVNQKPLNWQNRAHFFAIAAQIMRHILVDMARGRRTDRRGGGTRMLSLEDILIFSPGRAAEVVALDDALSELSKLDERKGRVVEMRFFGGLGVDEIAEVLKISPETVTREWKRARAWLYCYIANPATST